MKHYTLKHIRQVEKKFIPCPFCGKRPRLVFSDYEGNPKDQDSEEYLCDPWSGLSFWIAHPEENCPIATDYRGFPESVYFQGYDTPEEALAAWNKREQP